MKKEKKLTWQAAVLSAAGIAGTVLWQKKDLVKAIAQLHRYPNGWVLLQREPEVFLTKQTDKSKENLFEYLRQSPWRLVDQVADGYFWMNEKEEILLLTQKKVMKDYWSWTASRSFFQAAAEAQKPIEFDEYDYDMTQVEDEPENPADKQQPTE
ncbi:MAG: hypothetical protein ACLUKQ_09520 [Peptococcaceae bacterium]